MRRISPRVSVVEGTPVPARRQGIQIFQGQTAPIGWTIRDDQGDPVDLSAYGLQDATESSSASSSAAVGSVRVRVLEALSFGSAVVPLTIDASVRSTAEGTVEASLPYDTVKLPGIFLLEWAVLTPDGDVAVINQGSLIINRGLSGEMTANGPPSVPEIRLHLRDSDPGENFLIDEIEFDLAELAACIERPVMYWNESLPPISERYTTKSFPYRFRWLDGIVAGLFSLAAMHYRRNDKQFQAQGVSLRDKGKAQEYEAKYAEKWQEFKLWTQTTKASINLEGAYGSTSESF